MARFNLSKFRSFETTAFISLGTPGMKGTPARGIDGAGNLPGQNGESFVPRHGHGNGLHKGSCIGMTCLFKNLFGFSYLHDATEIHDRNTVGHMFYNT